MKKIILTITLGASTAIFLFLPLLASAQSLPNVWSPSSIAGPLVTCQGNIIAFPMGVDGNGNLNMNPNACQNLCNLVFTIVNDIYVGIAFVIWIILPIMFVVGGIMYMMGGANPDLLTTARSALKGAVIGAIIVLCAYLLIATFVQFMNISNIGGFSSNAPSVCTL